MRLTKWVALVTLFALCSCGENFQYNSPQGKRLKRVTLEFTDETDQLEQKETK